MELKVAIAAVACTLTSFTNQASAQAVAKPADHVPAGLAELLDQFAERWNAQNVHQLSMLWAEDGRLYPVGARTPIIGRAAIERAYRAGFDELVRTTPYEPSSGYRTVLQVHPMITPHLGLKIMIVTTASEAGVSAAGTWEVVNDLGPDGTVIDFRYQLPPPTSSERLNGAPRYRGSWEARVVRSGSTWLLMEFHVRPVAPSPSS